jgi:hypothetical protein
MLCSHLEGYVEDVLLEAVDRMAGARMPLKRLPVRLRHGHAFRDVRDLAAITDPDKFVTGLDAFVARNAPLAERSRLHPGLIDGDRLRAGFATPTSDAIKSLLSLVGVEPERVLPEAFRNSPRTRFRVTNLVDAMVARRQEVAHGDMNASVTQADVLSYLTAVHMLGARLDLMVGAQLDSLDCRPWR